MNRLFLIACALAGCLDTAATSETEQELNCSAALAGCNYPGSNGEAKPLNAAYDATRGLYVSAIASDV